MAKDINVDVKVTGLGDLRAQLKAAREDVIALQNADVIDPQAIAQATQRAGALKDALNDANEQIKIMSGGTTFEQVSTGLGVIGDQLSNLDFEGAANTAKGLTNAIKGMDPKEVQAGFKALTGAVGQLGTAFLQMGLKLLMNPIFLLVAVVAAIVAAFVLLKDKISILGKAFDVIKAAIGAVIQVFKDLTDWMGITAFAAEESADRQIAASEKAAKKDKEVTDSRIAGINRRIALAKAEGKDTTKLELDRIAILDDANKKEVQRARDNFKVLDDLRKKNNGKLTDEQRKTYEESGTIIKSFNGRQADLLNEKKVIIATKEKEIGDEERKALEKRKATNDAASKAASAEVERQKNALKALERKYITEVEDLLVKSDEERLALQKKREQAELDSVVQSKEAKLKAQAALDEKYKILSGNLEKKKGDEILKTVEEFGNKTKDLQAKTLLEKFNRDADVRRVEEAAKIKELQDLGATEDQIAAVKAFYREQDIIALDAYNAAKKDQRDKDAADADAKRREEAAAEQAAAQHKADVANQIGSIAGGLNKILADAGVKNKGILAAGIIAENAAAVGSIIMNTQVANLKALAASPLTKGQPFVTLNYVQMGLSLASTALAAGKALSALGKGGSSQSTPNVPGGGGGSAPAVPATVLRGATSADNVATGAQSVEAPQQNIMVTAVVSETQITSTQNRVAQMQRSAEL